MNDLNSLQPLVKYPLSVVRGCTARRQQKAIELTDKLFQDLYSKYKNNRLPFEEIARSIKKVTQNKLRIKVINEKYMDYMGSSAYSIGYNPVINGHILAIDSNKKFLNFSDLITVLHEFQHIADSVFNPKYMARFQYIYGTDMVPEKLYDEFTQNVLYKKGKVRFSKNNNRILKEFKRKTLEFLKDMTAEEKINIIQDSRYFLLSEIQAYKTQHKYAKKLWKKGFDVYEDDLAHVDRELLLTEKVQILKQLGFDIIQQERNRFASNLSKMKKCKSKND